MDTTKVLVVDDEQELTFILSTVLEFNKYEVKVVNDPNTAAELLEKENYEIIISDYMMDGMDGLELLNLARNKLKLQDLKMILLTFKDLDNDELAKLSGIGAVYLKKPFLPNELISKIEEISSNK